MHAGLSTVCLALCASAAIGELRVTNPRCEYGTDPMGIDVAAPRLSWEIESPTRGESQVAYRVLAGSSPEKLVDGMADVWDSGVVRSDQSIQVEYGGKALASRQKVYWKVQVWGNHDDTGSGPVSTWEMGLVEPEDWRGSWIGMAPRAGDPAQALAGARWIWYPEGGPPVAAPPGERFFRRDVEIPRGDAVKSARLTITADDLFELFIDGQAAGASPRVKDGWRQVRTLDVSKFLGEGRHALALKCTNDHHAAGLVARLEVTLASGGTVGLVTDAAWKVTDKVGDGWTTAVAGPGWVASRDIAGFGEDPWGALKPEPVLGMCPHVRKEVTLEKPVKSARLYASALGLYEMHINGRRVGDDRFNPGWTDYGARVQYHTYDVTGMLHPGANALGMIVGDGWYAGHVGLGGPHRYGPVAHVMAQLEVEFDDGTRTTVVTDGSWKGSAGPILQSDMLMGENYDARRELPGWDTPGYSDSAWGAVQVGTFSPRMVAACDGPVRVVKQLRPRASTRPRADQVIFDLGQNMVGWARLGVKGGAGDTVTLRFAEILNPDGTIYTTNLRGARCTDTYTLKGGAGETFEPRFTFHGFRYVEVTFPPSVEVGELTGMVAQSDTPASGTFECSEPRVNQLQSNIVWGQRGNFLSVPTDCPQRDERLGWMGDAQIFVRTATFNMDVSRFFTKWCRDIDDAQRPDGAFTDVSPFVAAGSGTAAWGDAGVICAWTIYRAYGDTRILREHFDAGARWIEYLRAHSENLLRPASGYGDWIAIGADTPKDVLATAYFAESTRIMAMWAGTIGKAAEAEKYRELFEKIRAAFNAAYVSPEGRIKGDTQTCYVLALDFDLLPEELRARAAGYLVADIRAKGDHLTTGFVGVGHLTPTLTSVGATDVAYKLLLQDTFPSWLYSVKNGATTIWERWDGWTAEKGFQDPGMNSFNHYSLGSVGQWMYSTVLGIDLDPQVPGFKHAVIHPRPGGGMTWAKGGYRSMYGRIDCSWRKEKDAYVLDVLIPANTTATVYLPGMAAATEGGKSLEQAAGIRGQKKVGDELAVEVESGSYSFRVQ